MEAASERCQREGLALKMGTRFQEDQGPIAEGLQPEMDGSEGSFGEGWTMAIGRLVIRKDVELIIYLENLFAEFHQNGVGGLGMAREEARGTPCHWMEDL